MAAPHFLAFTRPFIREPDFPRTLQAGRRGAVDCVSCNICLMHDGFDPLQCWRKSAAHLAYTRIAVSGATALRPIEPAVTRRTKSFNCCSRSQQVGLRTDAEDYDGLKRNSVFPVTAHLSRDQ